MEARTKAKWQEPTHHFLSKQEKANKDKKPKTEQIAVLETQI